MSVGHELLNVPFPEMVYQLASSIAKAQANLDRESIEILKVMGDKENAPVALPAVKINDDGSVSEEEITTSMIGAGFQPTFYQFAETIIEVKMAITMSYESSYTNTQKGEITVKKSSSSGNWWNKKKSSTVTTTPIDASYSNKYNYTQEGSSLLRTRLVPVPPNAIIQRQLDMRAQAMQCETELKLAEIEAKIEIRKAQVAAEIAKLESPASTT